MSEETGAPSEQVQDQASPEPVQPSYSSADELLAKTNAAADRLEAATRAMQEASNRAEALMVERQLAGNAQAGVPQDQPETDAEYAKRMVKGG